MQSAIGKAEYCERLGKDKARVRGTKLEGMGESTQLRKLW